MLTYDQLNLTFNKAELTLTENQYDKFKYYCELLKQWNEVMNLTSIIEDEDVAVKHFCDSALPLKWINIPENSSLLDVGSGAGFPGLPISIMRKDIAPTFLDSLEKRLRFIDTVMKSIHVQGHTIHARAEDAGKNPLYRETFDVVTARAVANLSVLAEYCLPFTKVNGLFLALKGPNATEEGKAGLTAIEKCGGAVENIIEYQLPNGDGRTLFAVRKIKHIAPCYPRNAAAIKKKPL